MFDYKQDIGLLHSSLLSAANLKSDNLFDCAEVQDAVQIVYNSIKLIIHNSLKAAKDEKEKINIQLHCNERLHASLFFTTLRSYGIKSQSADEYYDSILYNWPSINFKFYTELNFKCDWSTYFVKCALQLPSEVLLDVLKIIFEIPFESDIKYYSWHLILQTLIFKLCQASNDKEIHYSFDFDFVVESASTFKEKSLDELIDKNSETNKVYDKINEENYKTINSEGETIYKGSVDKSSNVYDNDHGILMKENSDSVQISNKITEPDDEDTEEEEDEYLIPFSYAISDNEDEITKIQSEDLNGFKELCCCLHDNIALKLEESKEIGALKILLHAVKTISKNLKSESIKDDANILPFNNYLKLLKKYLSVDVMQEKIESELKECLVFTKHAYATVSWNICLKYLLFLLKHYTEEIYPGDSCYSLLDSDSFYKNLISAVHCLYCFKYKLFKSSEDIALLCNIIKFELEGSFYAVKIALCNAKILKESNVLTTLEENCHLIDLPQLYSLLVDQIMSIDTSELKQCLLKIFYTCLQMNKLDMYNTMIGYILTNYGLTDEFQLPDYNDLLSDVTYQTPNQEQIEQKIPPLLIQNPKSTLKYLMDEALLQGSEGEIFIQFLKHLKNACFYVKNSGPVCILHEILNDYFQKPKLEALFLKNMLTLYKFLAQVHSETPILLPCDFFNECVIPKLYPDFNKIGLLLECTHILMPALLSDDSIMKDSEVIINLITKCGILTNYFIMKGNGEKKSLILPILKELEIHQQKNGFIDQKQKFKLWSTFKNFDEMTCVYFEEFLPDDIELDRSAVVWIRCCKNEDLSNFEAKFSVANLTYTSLVNTIVEVLPHLTKEEWSFCFNLVKVCCANNKVQEEITCSNNLFQLCGSDLDTYAALLSVITSVHFILNDNIDGSLYVSSCLSNFLKDALFKEEPADPHLLLLVALEICYLISSVSTDMINIYHATLLEMKKDLNSRSSTESDCIKLLNHTISCLPNLYQDENKELK